MLLVLGAWAIQSAADGVLCSVARETYRLRTGHPERLNTALTAKELEYLNMAAEAFAVGELFKTDHPLTATLVRKGVLRTSGPYVMITDLGVDVLRSRGYAGPLPLSRAKVLRVRTAGTDA